MKFLAVHPSALMYTKVFLRLEPLGLESVAQVVRQAGHQVRLIDLQVETPRDYFRLIEKWRPHIVAFSGNYLANVPEIVDLCKLTKERLPQSFVLVGGHSASFIAKEFLEHGEGAIDCIVKGEGEAAMPQLLEAIAHDRCAIAKVPVVVTHEGPGPSPHFVHSLDDLRPARDLLRHRRRYFIGVLDPCASIEFTRGCPWDCAFCSAWTFYGRSYRQLSPEAAAEDLAQVQEPNVFIVDDVAFIHPEQGMAIGQAIEKRRVRKQYYLETRCDVLLRNQEVFAYWKRLGLKYMFLGLEALDEEGLKLYRKRATPNGNFKALEVARGLGIKVAINIIADPSWDERRFRIVREWATSVPEIVHLTVNTPYPGTETWFTEARQLTSFDYRLFDVQHAVLPTKLPLKRFYEELVKTQAVLNRKHLGVSALWGTFDHAVRLLMRGQTNFVRMLWKFNKIYHPERQYADHFQPLQYTLEPPELGSLKPATSQLYVHAPIAGPRRAVYAEG